MIVRDRPSGLRLFFRSERVDFIEDLESLAGECSGRYFSGDRSWLAVPLQNHSDRNSVYLDRSAPGNLSGFRNNTAYDRYWEDKKLWGQLVSDTQNLSRHSQNLIQQPAPVSASLGLTDIRVRMIYRAIAYAHSLRDRLRNAREAGDLSGLLQEEERRQWGQSANGPNFLMFRMGADLGQCVRKGRIDTRLAASIDATLSSMPVAGASGCERIKNTPIPFSYTLLVHHTAYLYCFLLPFGLVDSIVFMTPFVVAIVA